MTNFKTRLFATLALACALVASLAGCGGASKEELSRPFVGTWAIDGVVSGGVPATEQELDLYKAMGVYLVLGSDNTLLFELFGVSVSGTWEPVDNGKATVSFSVSEAADAGVAAEQELELGDGKLSLVDGTDTRTFVQIDPADKQESDLNAILGSSDASNLEETLLALRKELSGSVQGTAPLDDAKELDQFVAGDAVCEIAVKAVGTYQGDPGYLLTITNKSDERIIVDDDAFEVGGQTADAVLLAIVDPGSTTQEVLWFDSSKLDGDGVDALESVSGKLTVTGFESGEVLGTYDFAA